MLVRNAFSSGFLSVLRGGRLPAYLSSRWSCVFGLQEVVREELHFIVFLYMIVPDVHVRVESRASGRDLIIFSISGVELGLSLLPTPSEFNVRQGRIVSDGSLYVLGLVLFDVRPWDTNVRYKISVVWFYVYSNRPIRDIIDFGTHFANRESSSQSVIPHRN